MSKKSKAMKKSAFTLVDASLYVTCDHHRELEAMIGQPHPQFAPLRCVCINATPEFDIMNGKRVYIAHYWGITDQASWSLVK